MDLQTAKLMSEYEAIRNARNAIIASANDRMKEILGEEAHALWTNTQTQVNAQIEAELKDTEASFAVAEEAIKKAVIANGGTIDGVDISVQFVKGSVKWDSAKLEGYAVTNPEILQFRTIGNPTTKIMPKKKK